LDEGQDSINFCDRMASDCGLHAWLNASSSGIFAKARLQKKKKVGGVVY